MLKNSYDRIAPLWNANRRSEAYEQRILNYVDKIIENLLPGAKILDLGCGTGNPIAKYLVAKKFDVTGIDQSKEMLKLAETIVPEAELIHADIVDFELNENFSAAIAWDSIFHIERKYHLDIYRKISNSLEPGGRFFLSVGGSDIDDEADPIAEGFTSEMFGETFFTADIRQKLRGD